MNWRIINDLDYKDYMQEYQINSLLAKIFAYKQYSKQDIELMLSNRLMYHDFSLFSEAEITLERIQEAIENQEKICIYGDYDCDGILATAILVDAFRQLGVEVGYHIPNRQEDGYGLNVNRVEQIASKNYSLIITVDNGIKAYDAIERANELGVDVIVTDHHNYDDELPDVNMWRWSVWKVNQNMKRIGRLTEKYRTIDIGPVLNPWTIAARIRTGKFDADYLNVARGWNK